MLAKLGNFKFEINTAAYDKLVRKTKYLWQQQSRFGGRNALQFTGFGEDRITLSGTIYPDYKGGIVQIDAMREQAKLTQPLELVTGYNNVGSALGKWVILAITEEQSYLHTNGAPRKQTFQLELEFYG